MEKYFMDTQITPMPTGIIQNNSTSTSNVTLCSSQSIIRRGRIKGELKASTIYWLLHRELEENIIEVVRKYNNPEEELKEDDKESIKLNFSIYMEKLRNNNEKIEKIKSGDYIDFFIEIDMFLRNHFFCVPKSIPIMSFFETLHNVVNCALGKTGPFDPELYKRATFEVRGHVRRFNFLKEEIPCPTREESSTENQTAYFSSTPNMK